ncbi:lysine--tRNA ligase [Planococcus plakortidis]|uniref:lysine--tRNA ligase n=1 Tax=Planococcus plakortidis TaxID=1038856 RepID=UPI00385B90DA
MHWAEEMARQIIERHPEKQEYVCASGISPSGSVHIGNFREVVTTYFVSQALIDLGKKVRFIFSWDDYDRFRKVPANVPEHFERYIGIPYSETPDPWNQHSSYARHFQEEFEGTLRQFDMEIEYIYQNQEYQSGRYADQIIYALDCRREIYDILMKYKTATPTNEEREDFYPLTVYCKVCGKDSTVIHSWSSESETYSYSCDCGFEDDVSIRVEHTAKLNWKVDWAMRWAAEQVDFEPGGRDHSSVTGSYTVSKEIAQEIFNYEAPLYLPYEFIHLKGNSKKMSSSSGNLLTPNDLLKVYPASLILFLFAKQTPSTSFHIGLDDDVIRNYSEFERYLANFDRQTPEMQQSLRWSGAVGETGKTPAFAQVAAIAPMTNFKREILKRILDQEKMEYEEIALNRLLDRIEYWIANWMPERKFNIRTVPYTDFYHQLSSNHKKTLTEFVELLQNRNAEQEEVLDSFYEVTRSEDKKHTRQYQKEMSRILYQLILTEDQGPRIPLLVQTVGKEHFISLISFS